MDKIYLAPACDVLLINMRGTILNSSPFNASGSTIANTGGEVDLDEL